MNEVDKEESQVEKESEDVIRGERQNRENLQELEEGVEKTGQDINSNDPTKKDEKETESLIQKLGNVLKNEEENIQEEEDAIQKEKEAEDQIGQEINLFKQDLRELEEGIEEFLEELEKTANASREETIDPESIHEEVAQIASQSERLAPELNSINSHFEHAEKNLNLITEGIKEAVGNLEIKENLTGTMEREAEAVEQEAKQDRDPAEIQQAEQEENQVKKEEQQERKEEDELAKEEEQAEEETEELETEIEEFERTEKMIQGSILEGLEEIEVIIGKLAETNYKGAREQLNNDRQQIDQARKDLAGTTEKAFKKTDSLLKGLKNNIIPRERNVDKELGRSSSSKSSILPGNKSLKYLAGIVAIVAVVIVVLALIP